MCARAHSAGGEDSAACDDSPASDPRQARVAGTLGVHSSRRVAACTRAASAELRAMIRQHQIHGWRADTLTATRRHVSDCNATACF